MTRNVGNAAEVVASFARYNDGGPNRTPAASVPGGRRLHYSRDVRGTVTLYSYRTEVAVRLADGRYAVTSARYGPSTGKALGRLRRALAAAGMGPTGEYVTVDTAVPGRWGGYGPAWHPTGRETYPFAIYDVPGERRSGEDVAASQEVRLGQSGYTIGMDS